MTLPFTKDEYARRARVVHERMAEAGLDAIFITDPSNINWLTGYDAWSFYVPQAVLLTADGDPVWMGREMDAGAARFTTYLNDDQIVPVPEDYVQRPDRHSGDVMAAEMAARGLGTGQIGYEADGYYLSPRWLERLRAGLPGAGFVDADLLVNWARLVKSEAEIEVMQTAADIAGATMRAAMDLTQAGTRQSDIMAEAVRTEIAGVDGKCGHLTAIYPLILAGKKATTAHPMWDDSLIEADQTIAFELGGCRHRYNAGLARTVHVGTPSQKLLDTSKAVEEGMEAVLSMLRAGVTCEAVHAAWQGVLDRYGLEKKSRIGYAIGVGYTPDWGERTVSLRPGEMFELPENAVLHVMLGMWLDDWGMELSETVQVQARGARCLTRFDRGVHVVA